MNAEKVKLRAPQETHRKADDARNQAIEAAEMGIYRCRSRPRGRFRCRGRCGEGEKRHTARDIRDSLQPKRSGELAGASHRVKAAPIFSVIFALRARRESSGARP